MDRYLFFNKLCKTFSEVIYQEKNEIESRNKYCQRLDTFLNDRGQFKSHLLNQTELNNILTSGTHSDTIYLIQRDGATVLFLKSTPECKFLLRSYYVLTCITCTSVRTYKKI